MNKEQSVQVSQKHRDWNDTTMPPWKTNAGKI